MNLAESPAEFFAENKNIAGFDNVSFLSSFLLNRCRIRLSFIGIITFIDLELELRFLIRFLMPLDRLIVMF